MKHFLISLLMITACASPAFSADGKLDILGNYDNWTAYVYHNPQSPNTKVCYMASEPIKSTGKYKVRDDVFLFVTHHLNEKTFNKVNVTAGYTYKKGSTPLLGIDKNKSITLTPHADSAWTKDAETDKKLVAQMIKGSTATLRGTSARGTLTTDTFSLKGFSKAYHDIQKACGQE